MVARRVHEPPASRPRVLGCMDRRVRLRPGGAARHGRRGPDHQRAPPARDVRRAARAARRLRRPLPAPLRRPVADARSRGAGTAPARGGAGRSAAPPAAAGPHADRARRPRPPARGRGRSRLVRNVRGRDAPAADPAVHRRPDRRAGGHHPGRPGDRDPVDGRAPRRRLDPGLAADALAGARRVAALQRRAAVGAPAGARGARRRARDLRRRTAADPGLPHRHPRPRAPHPAHPRGGAAGARAPLRRPDDRLGDAPRADRLRPAARSSRRAAHRRRGDRRRRRRGRPAAGLAVSEPVLTGAPGHTDAATFAFADRAAGFFGLARAGAASGPEGGLQGSALAILFAGLEPHARWHVSVDAPGGAGFELEFAAASPPAELTEGDDAALLGGMAGHERLCRVTGTAAGRPIDCLGQRGRSWGVADWSRIALTRSLGAWLEDGSSLTVAAVRPEGAESHADEATWGALLDAEGAMPIADPRVSTTYDGDGHQRRAGLELWVGEEDEYPRRGAGQVLCGSSVELGQLRLDCAFFAWQLDGREGVGRYDLVRRA